MTPLPEDGAGCGEDGATTVYPHGPCGTVAGATVPNYVFTGYARPGEEMGEAYRGFVSLADFYNPSGDGLFEAGSPYGEGSPKPRALMVNKSALWCLPCQDEARRVLPEMRAEFGPKGLQILVAIIAGVDPGVEGNFDDLDLWIESFDVNYLAVIDPHGHLGAIFDSNAFPGNMIIDTTTMRIIEVVGGEPGDSF